MQSASQLPSSTPLAAAQSLHQQLLFNAEIANARYRWLHLSQIAVAVGAALLAVLTCFDGGSTLTGSALVVASIGFVALFALGQTFHDGRYGQVLTTGAAAILRAIIIYRTVLQCTLERDTWLCAQTAETRRYISDALSQHWILRPVSVTATESFAETSEDWLPDDYYQQQLEPHIEGLGQDLVRCQRRRLLLRWAVYGCAGLWGLLPLLGSQW